MKNTFAAVLLALVMAVCLPSVRAAAAAGDVWVDGVDLSGGSVYYLNGNAGGGSASYYNAWYDPAARTLRLNNLNVTGCGDACIDINAAYPVTIALTGASAVSTAPSSRAHALDAAHDLTIAGTGSLSATAHGASNEVGGKGVMVGGNLIVTGGSLAGTGGVSSYDACGVWVEGTISVSGGTLTGTGGNTPTSGASFGVRANAADVTSIAVSGTGILAGTGGTAGTNASYGVLANRGGVAVSGGFLQGQGGDSIGNTSFGVYAYTNAAVSGTGALLAAGGASTLNDSIGLYKLSIDGAITFAGGTIILQSSAVQDATAINWAPNFGTPPDNAWYKWRTADSGGYTDSRAAAYTWDVSPRHTYVEIRSINPSQPAVASQPQNAAVTAGGRATFSVAAAGVGPLAYQWQRNRGDGWESIPGAADASYTTPIAALSHSGDQYRCVITDINGSTASDAAALMVTAPPVIPETGDASLPWLWAGFILLAGAGLAASATQGQKRRRGR